MEIKKPRFYDSFRCLAGACPDSCCHEWTVVVDDKSAACYRTLPGPLGDRLRQVMAEEDGETVLTLTPDGRCPMWQDDGLCRIQAELGEDALCQTCAQFPRLRHDYGSFVELGLELSCPEAARLILTEDDSPVVSNIPGGEAPDYDPHVMEILLRSRKQALELLNDTRFSIAEALTILLLFASAVQNEIDGGEPAIFDPEGDLALACSLPLSPTGNPLEFCKSLNILTDRWRDRLSAPTQGAWEEGYRAIARYFVSRYWLQAVSDEDLIARAKLVAFSCIVIRMLGGELCQTAQLYSKEIENDAENIDAILDGAYTDPALTDSNLLFLLLEELT